MARSTYEVVNQFVADKDNREAVIHGQPLRTVGIVGAAVADEVRVGVYGMSAVSCAFFGAAATPNVTFEWSYDDGTTWLAAQMFSIATLTLASTSQLVFPNILFEGNLPVGATHFRVRCTVASGAGISVSINPASVAYRTSQVVNIVAGSAVAINSGAARIGTIGTNAQGAFNDETTTPLAGTGTFTGSTRDLTTTVSSGTFGAGAAAKEYRALAMSDVGGTLYVEVSADQVTYWRAYQQAAAAVGAIFVAQLTVLPVTRYARAVYVNGAAGQTAFLLSTARYGA